MAEVGAFLQDSVPLGVALEAGLIQSFNTGWAVAAAVPSPAAP